MPRPKKLTLDFFIHDANARNDRKIKALRRRHGNDGYATFFCLIEMLCQEDGMQMPLSNPLDIETVAEECGVRDSAHLLNIIQCCTEIGLLDKQLWESDRIVFSPGLYERYLARLEDRKQAALRKQRQGDASKLASRIQEIQAKENEVFPRDNSVSSRDNSPELSELSELSEPQNSQNAQSENSGSEGEKAEAENLAEKPKPTRHHDRPKPSPVQSNPAKPQTTEQGSYFAPDFLQQKNKVEQFDARMRRQHFPWNDDLGRLDQEFVEFVGKRLPKGDMHPRVKARNFIINCENGLQDIRKAWNDWADYQKSLKESAEKERLRQSAEIIPVAQPLPVYADDSTESLIARLKAKAKLPGQLAKVRAEALANGIPLEAIGLSEGAVS